MYDFIPPTLVITIVPTLVNFLGYILAGFDGSLITQVFATGVFVLVTFGLLMLLTVLLGNVVDEYDYYGLFVEAVLLFVLTFVIQCLSRDGLSYFVNVEYHSFDEAIKVVALYGISQLLTMVVLFRFFDINLPDDGEFLIIMSVIGLVMATKIIGWITDSNYGFLFEFFLCTVGYPICTILMYTLLAEMTDSGPVTYLPSVSSSTSSSNTTESSSDSSSSTTSDEYGCSDGGKHRLARVIIDAPPGTIVNQPKRYKCLKCGKYFSGAMISLLHLCATSEENSPFVDEEVEMIKGYSRIGKSKLDWERYGWKKIYCDPNQTTRHSWSSRGSYEVCTNCRAIRENGEVKCVGD